MPASLTKVVNSIYAKNWNLRKLQKHAKPPTDELVLEMITYEKQQKDKESLSLELIYDDQATKKGAVGLNAVEEQVLKLEEQQAKMVEASSSKDVEAMRGIATGLPTRQLEAIRKHAEKATLDEQEKAVEMLRGAAGLQRTQLEALKKHADRQQAQEQQITVKVAASNPPRSRL